MSEARPVPLIAIRAEVLLSDPNMCKFTVSQSVHPGGPFFFDRPEHAAAGSPLPEQLFGLAGVAHVLISENVVSVGKLAEVEWSQLKAAIGARIRAQLLTGAPSILENTSPKVHWGRPDTEVARRFRSCSTVKSTVASPDTVVGSRWSITKMGNCESP